MASEPKSVPEEVIVEVNIMERSEEQLDCPYCCPVLLDVGNRKVVKQHDPESLAAWKAREGAGDGK